MQLLNSFFPHVLERLPELGQALIDTFAMLFFSAILTVIGGGLLGIILVATRKGGILQNLAVWQLADKLTSIFRSIPFIILLALVMPLSRLIVGTTIGVAGAIVPLVLGAIPFYARQVESALLELDPGLIEAARAMGVSPVQIIFRVYLKESVAGLARGLTITLISLLNLTAMAGVVGAGGIGDYAIRYGHDRNQYDITLVAVVILVILVGIIQLLGNSIAGAAEARYSHAGDGDSSEEKTPGTGGVSAQAPSAKKSLLANPYTRRVFLSSTLSVALIGALLLGSLGLTGAFNFSAKAAQKDQVTIKIGFTGALLEDLWSSTKAKLADEGINLEYVQFSDYTQPNNALNAGEIDLNAFQHTIFFETEKKSHGYKLSTLGYTTIQPMNLFSTKYSSLDELKDGDKVAVPNDVTNGGRALKVLESAGLIKIDPKVGYLPTVKDIVAYNKNIKIEELAANTIPSALSDLGAAVINGNYALDFNLSDDEILYHDEDLQHEEYWNLIAARDEDLADPKKKEIFDKILRAFQTEETKRFLDEELRGYYLPIGWEN